MRRRSRIPNRYAVITVLAVLAVLSGMLAPWTFAAFVNDTSARDRIAADPLPPLFRDSTVASTRRQVDAQAPHAVTLMGLWWSSHGTARQDTAFATWVERALPGPPTAARRTAELRRLRVLASGRTPTGVIASKWLDAYGDEDVWKLYARDQGELLPAAAGDRRASDVKDLLAMSKVVTDALSARYHQPSPYVLQPELRTDKAVTPGQGCPCSFPSHHAAASAAARTFLSHLAPHRADDYRWMESEVDYSRVYMAGHVPSDIDAGALLGDMIGQYFLVTRAHATVGAAAAGVREVALSREAVPAAGHPRG